MAVNPSLRLCILLVVSLAGAAPASADQIFVRGRGPLEGQVVDTSPQRLVLETEGWRVELSLRDVVGIKDAAGFVRLPLADRAEDRGLTLESRGRFALALEAYAEAAHYVMVAAREGVLSPPLASARLEVYLRRTHFFALKSRSSTRMVEITSHIADDPALSPTCRDAARTYRAMHLRALGRFDQARADQLAMGVVDAFLLAGSFDNERGTGYDQAFGPETQPFDPQASFQGKKHQVVWRPQPVEAPPLGIIELDSLMRPNDQALVYAITYLHAKAKTPVALRIGSDEALKVWVNRTLVLERNVSRDYEHDQDHVGVVLSPGWNQVLLKVCDQTGDWAFRLRVTAPDGGTAEGVRSATLAEIAANPKFEEGAAVTKVAGNGIEALTAAAERFPKDWRTLFHLGYLHFGYAGHDQTEHPDRSAFQAAVELQPELSALRVFLSLASGGKSEFSVNREDNAKRVALEKAIELDPENHNAGLRLARYYAEDLGNRERARALVGPVVAKEPAFMDARLFALDLDAQRGLRPLVKAELERLYLEAEEQIQSERAETFPQEILERLSSDAGSRGEVRRQILLIEQQLEIDRSDAGLYASLADLHAGAGNTQVAEILYGQALRLAPFQLSLRTRLSRLLQNMGRLEEAAEILRGALRIAPDDESMVQALGHLEERRGRTKQADQLFAQALELNPNLVDLKKYLAFRARGQAKQVAFEDAWIVDPAPLVAASRDTPLDPRRTHRTLFRQEVARVNQDGTKSEFVQEVVRVENLMGARSLTDYPVIYETEQHLEFQRAQVFRKSGAVEEAPVGSTRGRRNGEFSSRRRFSVRFPPLEPGDVIAVRYRVDDLEEGFFGDYYGKIAYFQSQTAMDWMRYVLIAPAGRELFFHTPGLEGVKHVTQDQGQTVVHVFEKKGIPPLESEPNMPWSKEVIPQVQVSTFKDWDDFSRWYWGLVSRQHEADPAIKKKVAELCAGAKTDEEKIRRIYNYVVTDIRYNASWEFGIHGFKPYNATKIFARKFGDCKDKATLIGTMLGQVGIEAHPVLIFGEDRRGREDLSLPLMSHFNHCISWVNTGEEDGLFLDGTAEHHPFATLPTMDYGANVVVITPEKGLLKTIPFRGPEANSVRERHTLHVQRGGRATLRTTIHGEGTYGVILRDALQTEGRRKDVLEPRIGSTFSGAKVTSVKTSDLEDLDTPVKVDIEVEVPNVLRRTADGRFELREMRSWLFDLIYLGGNKISSLAAESERHQDVILPVPSGLQEDLIYELPPDVRVESLPASVNLEAPFGTYELKYEQDGPRLRVRRSLSIKTNRIPLKDYQSFRKFVREIEQAESQRPVLGSGGAE